MLLLDLIRLTLTQKLEKNVSLEDIKKNKMDEKKVLQLFLK